MPQDPRSRREERDSAGETTSPTIWWLLGKLKAHPAILALAAAKRAALMTSEASRRSLRSLEGRGALTGPVLAVACAGFSLPTQFLRVHAVCARNGGGGGGRVYVHTSTPAFVVQIMGAR